MQVRSELKPAKHVSIPGIDLSHIAENPNPGYNIRGNLLNPCHPRSISSPKGKSR